MKNCLSIVGGMVVVAMLVSSFVMLFEAFADDSPPTVTIEKLKSVPSGAKKVPLEDPYKDFKPCKPGEQPFGKDVPPPFPLKDANGKWSSVGIGCTFQWWVNHKTGEYLYKNLGPSKIGLFLRMPDGSLKELKGTANPEDAK